MKTKKIKVRQGFTIVELVIVIGVIGVLTAVLVPTFINLNQKANQAADEALIKNLNTQLRIKETSEGKNKTLTAALADAAEAGYLVENLTPKSGKDIVWNQEKDEFSQLEAAPTENAYKFWKIYEKAEDIPSAQTYSIFAKGKAWTTVPTLTVGFDAGENTEIATLNFETTATREVTIRTNGTGTALTVNAANATVNHYDVLDGLTVTAIAGESYHEWGAINSKAVIKSGHIEVENGASVPEVSVEGATGAVKVTANEGTLVTADTASAAQTSVVANSADVFVSGVSTEKISGSKASEVELPTVITTEDQLTNAIGSKKAYLQLGANFSVEKTFVISYKALFDFAGFTVSSTYVGTTNDAFAEAVNGMDAEFEYVNSPFIHNKNALTFVDSKQNGGVTSANNLVVLNEGSLLINGGRFESTAMIHKYYSGEGTSEAQDDYMSGLGIKRGVIRNEKDANCIINNCSLATSSDYGVYNKGDITINGGSFVSTSNSTNGTAYAYCVSSGGGEMVINGGDVTGQHGAIAVNGGTAVINNVHSETKKGTNAKGYYRALYVAGEVGVAGVEINGGYFKSYNMEALLTGNKNDGGVGALAMTNIHGGTFVNGLGGANPAVKVSGGAAGNNYGIGMMTIDGGKFSSNVSGASGVKTCVQGEDGLWVVNA